jgi:hypothetical protein
MKITENMYAPADDPLLVAFFKKLCEEQGVIDYCFVSP